MLAQDLFDKMFENNPTYNKKIKKYLISHVDLTEKELIISRATINKNHNLSIEPRSTFLVASNYPVLSKDFDLSSLMNLNKLNITLFFTRYSCEDIKLAKEDELIHQYEYFFTTGTFSPVEIEYHLSRMDNYNF